MTYWSNTEASLPAKPDFMTDPEHLKGLEGRRFIVLRPTGEVSKVYKETQARFKELFTNKEVTYPNTEHVMLRGYPSGTELKDVTEAAETLMGKRGFKVEILKLATFPSPFKIIVFEVVKTPELIVAYEDLSNETRAKKLPHFEPERSSDEWIFHMSVAYCEKLNDGEWEKVEKEVAEIDTPKASCFVDALEVVSYDDQGEHVREIKLS